MTLTQAVKTYIDTVDGKIGDGNPSEMDDAFERLRAALDVALATPSPDAIDAGAKILAGWIGYSWDDLSDRDISDRYPDRVPGSHSMKVGKPALRKVVARILSALAHTPETKPESWTPTHRHVKRGSEYEHIGTARIQSDTPLSDMDYVEVYLGREGDLWARRQSEFHDGRFESLRSRPLQPTDRHEGGETGEPELFTRKQLQDAVAKRVDDFRFANEVIVEKVWLDALEEAAELIKDNVIQDTSSGKRLIPRQDGNTDGLAYAAAIRALRAKGGGE